MWIQMLAQIKKFYKKFLVILIFTLVAGLTVNAYPGITACIVASEKNQFSITQKGLLQEAIDRIENEFGPMKSKPTVVFFNKRDSFWPLTLNEYGSTSFLGYKTCIMIGPKGQNIDVTAHELMHVEIEYRVGYWRRWLELPIWFDEGLAMQVDRRERYNLPKGTETSYVKQFNTVSDFLASDDKLLTNHYASAKSEVALWVSKVGTSLVYDHLNSIKEGRSFEYIWLSSKKELTNPSSGRNR